MYGKDRHKRPYFFGKESFLELLNCNGQEEVNLEDFSSKTQQ